MEKYYYTEEQNVQMVVALLKEHKIRKVVASPGTTNMTIVGSMQQDPYFEVYSSVDERSAAYIACGLAAESGEPVVLSCTGATASRNYMSGMTEAYYRKLPILAITSTQLISRIGHLIAQVIDRSALPKDVVKLSVTLPIIKDEGDVWDCEIKVNQAILELRRNGGGPVHINLPTTYSTAYGAKVLPKARVIDRISSTNNCPTLPKGRVAVFIGSHVTWTDQQTEILDKFCASNGAVVFCDHSSGYKGKYRLLYSLAFSQKNSDSIISKTDLLIHIGEITGDYSSLGIVCKEVWRVSEDGEVRDTFRKLRYVFEMPEELFFAHYTKNKIGESNEYLTGCNNQLNKLREEIPELPFSNIWIASQMASRIPENSSIHFGILNSLRSWNFFDLPRSVTSFSNVGGFGIDGCVSSLVGASLFNKNKLYFGVFGDLAFFYDMNVVGNRHVGNNLRILLINNGKGAEFRMYNNSGSVFGESVDEYIAAAGHFGNKSQLLIRNYAENLGFEYLCASNKEDFDKLSDQFLSDQLTQKPILMEVFTDSADESYALDAINSINKSVKGDAMQLARRVLGQRGMSVLKKVLKR